MEDKKAEIKRNILLTVIGVTAVLCFVGVVIGTGTPVANVNKTVLADPHWNLSATGAATQGVNISGTYVFNTSVTATGDNPLFNITNATWFYNYTHAAASTWVPFCTNTTGNVSALYGGGKTTYFSTCTYATTALTDSNDYSINVTVLLNTSTLAGAGTFNSSNTTHSGAIATFNVTVDNTQPIISAINEPVASWNLTGSGSDTFLINYTISDTTAGTRQVCIALQNATNNYSITGTAGAYTCVAVHGGATTAGSTGFYNATVNARDFVSGTYKIMINATDWTTSGTAHAGGAGSIGNEITNLTRDITIDNITPVITILEPTADQTTKDNTPFIKIRVSDNIGMLKSNVGPDSCKYRLDNGSYNWNFTTAGTITEPKEGTVFTEYVGSQYEYRATQPSPLTEGKHTLFVWCQDVAQNNASAAWSFTIDNDKGGAVPTGGRGADIDLGTTTSGSVAGSTGLYKTFTLDGTTTHKITIKSVTDTTVTLVVESEPIEITLTIGETKEVDVDKNGASDIKITLNSIKDGQADLTVEKIATATPVVQLEPKQPAPKGAGTVVAIVIVILIVVGIIGYTVYSRKKKK